MDTYHFMTDEEVGGTVDWELGLPAGTVVPIEWYLEVFPARHLKRKVCMPGMYVQVQVLVLEYCVDAIRLACHHMSRYLE